MRVMVCIHPRETCGSVPGLFGRQSRDEPFTCGASGVCSGPCSRRASCRLCVIGGHGLARVQEGFAARLAFVCSVKGDLARQECG